MSLSNPEAFERAYREHRAAAFAAAVHVLRDAAAAEDVVQDAFMQLWNRPGAFDDRRGSLRGYITLLARSRAIDRWRAQGVQASSGSTSRSPARRRGAPPSGRSSATGRRGPSP
jgi:RNA polymerase sigma factor (sigma-70 family)